MKSVTLKKSFEIMGPEGTRTGLTPPGTSSSPPLPARDLVDVPPSHDIAESPLQSARLHPLDIMSLGSAVISLLVLLRAASTAATPSTVEAAVSSLYSSRPFPHFELDGDWTNPARSLTQYVGPSHLPEINHHVRVYMAYCCCSVCTRVLLSLSLLQRG